MEHTAVARTEHSTRYYWLGLAYGVAQTFRSYFGATKNNGSATVQGVF
ncbi:MULTISPECIES: hypothetical protein [Lactobacillus]|uniref:Uncharacterized protein n=1 Tax=Lactobacillus helsingborgensis TaxID=1218494 RepID=A0AA47B5R3_9LACO|nr:MULTISPECIES: hypothetical protein [Lactobacillus]MCT6888886.1 hypothetical protein [Lactobacillus sp.]MBH9990479.1 hypothetical protein [Lactobacillus sp. M0392]MBI0024841.1 hypothetical protein [Lactobacillus sp. W8171]MBI0045520.1 hypothetical protein [Lactobacillus sp. M0393]NUE98960.1 hypothetical protein [Lactobacillus melliventris]